MTNHTPEHIVKELNRYIIGQEDAKRSVAVALRNRWRRGQIKSPMSEEIVPKNILMIGPTGVGKTEIARRIAKLSGSPFIKVEATKFTEVGYVGRDVDSIIRDLVENAVNMLKEQSHKEVKEKAYHLAQERVLDALVGETASEDTRAKFREKLQNSELDDKEIEVDVQDNPPGANMLDIPGMPGSQMGVLNIGDMLGKAMGGRTKTKRMTVAESYEILIDEESEKLVDEEQITRDALKKVEQEGIVFIDEVDKVAARSDGKGGEVSREGVQRDLLPLIEGTTVSTKYGSLNTDHILFIASGAFHMAKPSDLLPELQGRLPIRVVLNALTQDDMVRILKEPEFSLPKQYQALLDVENVTLDFTDEGIEHIAKIATEVNKNVENIGARRLHTILERLLENISFDASNKKGETICIDQAFVDGNLGDMSRNADLSRFIL